MFIKFIFNLLFIKVCLPETVFHFQTKNKLSNESRVVTFLTPLPDGTDNVTSYSLSIWFKVHYFRDSSFLFSYSISDIKCNEMNLYTRPNKLNIILSDRITSILYRVPVKITPMEWNHFGIAYDAYENNETIISYLNGEKIFAGNQKDPPTLFLNGSLVLGQETDKFNGGFSSQQSFCGKLSGLNIFSRVLRGDEFAALYHCSEEKNPGEGDILKWSSVSWSVDGAVEVEQEPICQRNQKPYQIINQKVFIIEARSFCKRMYKTDVYLPQTNQQNNELYKDSISFLETCKPTLAHGYSYFWLGANKENGTWRDFQGQLLNFTNFRQDKKNLIFKYVAFYIPLHPGFWNHVKSEEKYKFCFACNVFRGSMSPLYMRGLCDEEIKFSNMFRLEDDYDSAYKIIQGYTKYRIRFNESESSWNIFNTWTDQEVASYSNIIQVKYPIGIKRWTISTDYLICGLRKGEKITLSLSTCTADEFTCENGDCVAISQRCDLVANCDDFSDENNCQKLIVPYDYMKYLLPSGPDGNALEVNLTLEIERLSMIDVRDMRLRIDFSLQMTWFDSRLTFSNLKFEDDINIISGIDIWTPEYQYINVDGPSLYQTKPSLTINRTSNPENDDTSRPLRDEHFSGEANPIVYSIRGNAMFECIMDLGYYPFDTQTCSITLKFKSARTSLGKWGYISVLYTGQEQLLEYEIGKTHHLKAENYNFSIATISISLKRRYSYYFITIYAPTFMLLLISYASLFCNLNDPDLRIMMTITTLLVLYSAYQQISETLPKTSYIKAVDVWCFFSLSVIFSQIIFHVFIGSNIDWLKETKFSKGNISKIRKLTFDEDEVNRLKIFRYSRRFYIIITVFFTIAYVHFATSQGWDF